MDGQRVNDVLPYLPERVSALVLKLASIDRIGIEEIRLRCNEPLTVSVWGESCFVTKTGGITNHEGDAYKVSEEEVRTAFYKVCENSVYAHLEEIRKGFITIKGGHRVGICGKAVYDGEKIKIFKEISSLNFRIASQVLGIADGVIDVIAENNQVESTLIVSPPQMGKTTLLRDITRQLSNRGFKCGVADDRGELAAMYHGVPMNDIGAQTDVIDGTPKALAVEILLRTMSPHIIISDEIASHRDVEALRQAAGTGVKIIATTHGNNIDEVKKRNILIPMFEDRIFSRVIILKRDFSTLDSVIYTKVIRL